MEGYILVFILIFIIGIAVGVAAVLLFNKYKTGSLSSIAVKKEYESYQDDVEKHFEETSQRLKDMTMQYQELYKHLAVGATTLCRPESVAAGIADNSEPELKLENQPKDETSSNTDEAQAVEEPKPEEEHAEIDTKDPKSEDVDASDVSPQTSDAKAEKSEKRLSDELSATEKQTTSK